MAHLSLSLIGPPEVLLNGVSVKGFQSDKVRALLIYLAVEADRPHRRETLAGLLWPNWPNAAARKNLSKVLYNLRQSTSVIPWRSEFSFRRVNVAAVVSNGFANLARNVVSNSSVRRNCSMVCWQYDSIDSVSWSCCCQSA